MLALVLILVLPLLTLFLIQGKSRQKPKKSSQDTAIRDGFLYGGLLGLFVLVAAGVSRFIPLASLSDNFTPLFTLVVALVVFALSGISTIKKTKDIKSSALSGATAGLVSALLTGLIYLLMGLFSSMNRVVFFDNITGMFYLIVFGVLVGAFTAALAAKFNK